MTEKNTTLCPACRDVEMEKVDVHSVKVDRCPKCGGTWYDQGELKQLTDREGDGDYQWLNATLWQDADKVDVSEHSRRQCPTCAVPMASVRYGDPPVNIEVCPLCFGIWLDKGEYEKVVEHFEQTVDSRTVAKLLADAEGEFVELIEGREGFRKELSDLAKVFSLLKLRFAVEHPVLVKIKDAIRSAFPG
jgi:Zn-finger nucleic acid-binding protein